MEPVIQVRSGRSISLVDPQPEDIDIEDIAWALAMQCRYTGHTNKFYSVAEHSYYASVYCDPTINLAALLHDAGEAYLGDIASPLKRMLPKYHSLEEVFRSVIEDKYGLSDGDLSSELVKDIDVRMLATEVEVLMEVVDDRYADYIGDRLPVQALAGTFTRNEMGWNPNYARSVFMDRFNLLTR